MNSVGRREFLLGAAAAVAGAVLLDVGVANAATTLSMTVGGIGPFDVLSYSWGVGPLSKVHDLTIVKNLDGSSSALNNAVAFGTQFTSASLTVPGKNGKSSVRYDMTDVMVTSYQVSGTTDHVSFQFATLKTAHK